MDGMSGVRLRGQIRKESFGGLIFCIKPIRILMVNSTGYHIATHLTELCSVGSLIASLADEYGVSQAAIREDVTRFISFLDQQGLLDWKNEHR